MSTEKNISLQEKRTMPRKQLGIRLDEDLIDKLKDEASRRNRSVTNLIETILKKELDLL